MKKFKKNFSRTIFSSFFIFQFVITSSLMPMVARAEEGNVSEKSEAAQEEVSPSEVKEEVVFEESKEENVAPSEEQVISEEVVSLDQGVVDETPVLEDSAPAVFQTVGINAVLRVCKVLIDINGNVVDGSEFSGATFTIPFVFQGADYSVTLDASEYESLKQTFGIEESTFEAMCKGVTVPVDLPEVGLLPFSYGEEITSGDFTWEKSYNEGDLQNGYLYDGESPRFLPFGADASSDGQVSDLTGNQNTGFESTIFVVNKNISKNECDAPRVYARVNLENLKESLVYKQNPGWYNTGNGNMAPKIFVGGTNDSPNEVGGDVYDIGEWFPIYDPATGYVNDPILTSTDPGVPGLAIQRLDGQVRVVLFGSHAQPAGSPETNREMANGFLEFSNDQSTVSSDVRIVAQVIDAQNPPEMFPSEPLDGPSNDYISFTSSRANFKFVVTTHNDGMYTVFTHSLPSENCGGGDENKPPFVTANPSTVCILPTITEGTFNFLNGVEAGDPEDGALTASYSHNVLFGREGSYTIFYTVTDSDGLVAGTNRTVLIKSNCGGGEDDGIVESISVCKIIAKKVGNTLEVVPASEVPGYTFTVPWVSAPTTPGTEGFDEQTMIAQDAVFKTNTFTPNRKILASSTGDDAMCQTFSDLTLGSYFYGKETISGGDGSVEWTTKYSDQVLNPVDGFEDVYEYNDNLFTVGFDEGSVDYNGNSFNTNADGHIVLLQTRKVRTVVVINIFEEKNGDNNTPPKISINPSVRCIQTDALSYDYFGGVTASDLEDGDLTSSITYITNPNPVLLGQPGEYLITYTVIDSKGLSDTGTRTLYIKEDCGGGDGDKIPPVITFNPLACIEVNTSLDFMSGVVVTDNQDEASEITVKNNGSTIVDFSTVGSYTVTYTAKIGRAHV